MYLNQMIMRMTAEVHLKNSNKSKNKLLLFNVLTNNGLFFLILKENFNEKLIKLKNNNDFCKILCYNIFIILVKEKKDEKNFKSLS